MDLRSSGCPKGVSRDVRRCRRVTWMFCYPGPRLFEAAGLHRRGSGLWQSVGAIRHDGRSLSANVTCERSRFHLRCCVFGRAERPLLGDLLIKARESRRRTRHNPDFPDLRKLHLPQFTPSVTGPAIRRLSDKEPAPAPADRRRTSRGSWSVRID